MKNVIYRAYTIVIKYGKCRLIALVNSTDGVLYLHNTRRQLKKKTEYPAIFVREQINLKNAKHESDAAKI